MNIEHEQTPSKGAFYIEENGKRLAEMTYSKAGPNKLIIDHTDVDESLKGQGVGLKLLLALIDYVRANNIKVIPLCPFANSVFAKREDLRDVL